MYSVYDEHLILDRQEFLNPELTLTNSRWSAWDNWGISAIPSVQIHTLQAVLCKVYALYFINVKTKKKYIVLFFWNQSECKS